MARDDDKRRLALAKAFNRQALADIYDEYQPPIYRYISRQVEDMDTARDLTADVFNRFLDALRHGRGPDGHAGAWLYRAAHNIVVDHYRRRAFRGHLPLPEQLVDGEADPARQVENRLTSGLVHEALQTLTADQRQVITLKFLAGLSNAEVADIMEKPVGAVKALQHRALAALQRQLIPGKEKA
ncbi:MAG: sigma-70 family RNA polymerase sigma factor [Candidatus Promineifilaceae bacterium]